MSRRSRLTMDDVARAARVSKQRLSRHHNKSGISEKTRARVRQIIARLDYHPRPITLPNGPASYARNVKTARAAERADGGGEIWNDAYYPSFFWRVKECLLVKVSGPTTILSPVASPARKEPDP